MGDEYFVSTFVIYFTINVKFSESGIYKKNEPSHICY